MSKPSSDYRVVKIINEYKLVINKGSLHNLKMGQKFLIYAIDNEPIIDPMTNENLGYLEIIKGTGKITHLQDNLATIESDVYTKPSRRIIKNRNPMLGTWGTDVEEIETDQELVPFEDPRVGDCAKHI